MEHHCIPTHLADPCYLHTERTLLSPHQAHCCSLIQLAMPHHSRGEPGPAAPLGSCRGKVEAPCVWIQAPGEQGNKDQGHPCSTRCRWQSSSCLLLWCSFPRAQHCRGVLAGHSLAAFSPKEPALLGPAQQHLNTPRTTQISQPGASHHPFPLHLHFSRHPCPGQQRSSLFPHRTRSLAW